MTQTHRRFWGTLTKITLAILNRYYLLSTLEVSSITVAAIEIRMIDPGCKSLELSKSEIMLAPVP